jgi:hypothetical protein
MIDYNAPQDPKYAPYRRECQGIFRQLRAANRLLRLVSSDAISQSHNDWLMISMVFQRS